MDLDFMEECQRERLYLKKEGLNKALQGSDQAFLGMYFGQMRPTCLIYFF